LGSEAAPSGKQATQVPLMQNWPPAQHWLLAQEPPGSPQQMLPEALRLQQRSTLRLCLPSGRQRLGPSGRACGGVRASWSSPSSRVWRPAEGAEPGDKNWPSVTAGATSIAVTIANSRPAPGGKAWMGERSCAPFMWRLAFFAIKIRRNMVGLLGSCDGSPRTASPGHGRVKTRVHATEQPPRRQISGQEHAPDVASGRSEGGDRRFHGAESAPLAHNGT
jgi:hypothetical protein